MSQQDFNILKSMLVNALTLVGGGGANADALTAYAALYIAELDAFYRDQKRVPTSLEAKSPVGAGLKEDARRGVESALLRLASRAFSGAGRSNLTSELEPYEAARRTLGIAKDETRKTLDYLVSLERRGPHALTPQPPPPPPAQTPMRKGSKRTTSATPRRSPLRDVNANTSPVKKKSKNLKKAAPRSSGVTIRDQNAMAMRMSSTRRVDWTSTVSRPTNENEEKPRVVAGKPKNKVKAERKRDSASVAPARASTPAPVAAVVTSTLKNKVKVKVEAKVNTSVSSSATPAAVAAVAARVTSVATSTLKNKVKVKIEAKDNASASVSSYASPAATLHVAVNNASSSSIATTTWKGDQIRVKSNKST